jgi:hypothetical protein
MRAAGSNVANDTPTFRVQGLGSGCRVQGAGFRVQVQGSGFTGELPTTAENTEVATPGGVVCTVMVTSEDTDMGTAARVCPAPSGPTTRVTCGFRVV